MNIHYTTQECFGHHNWHFGKNNTKNGIKQHFSYGSCRLGGVNLAPSPPPPFFLVVFAFPTIQPKTVETECAYNTACIWLIKNCRDPYVHQTLHLTKKLSSKQQVTFLSVEWEATPMLTRHHPLSNSYACQKTVKWTFKMSNIDMVTWHFDVIIYGINHSKHVNHCDDGSFISAKTF